MAISLRTTKMLWGRAAARCSMPECRRPLVIDSTETDDEALIGEMCHMVAASEDGPRGRSTLTSEQRDLYDNLILLCRNHHGEIDAQPETFPVERLKAIKADHEQWVREALPGYDSRRQRDDEIFASYIDEWTRRCNLDNWTDWTSFVLGGDHPQMTVTMHQQLEELGPWLLGRVWPDRYPALKRAFTNFRIVLQDLRNTFLSHAERPTPDNDWLMTVKFYQIREHDKERYERLSRAYDFHVGLVCDLMLELTRAANLICDEVRSSIMPTFRLAQGVVMVESGPHLPDGSWRTFPVHYTPEEREDQALPYPGLDAFKQVRFTRDRWFGDPKDEKRLGA
jgi:hypothetical protein